MKTYTIPYVYFERLVPSCGTIPLEQIQSLDGILTITAQTPAEEETMDRMENFVRWINEIIEHKLGGPR